MALDDKLAQLPGRPGVYLFKDAAGRILYVGKARVLRDRVRSYFQASRPAELHKTRLVEEIADLELVVTDSEMEALALENNLIKRHQPPYNVRLRDDKNHPYLKLTLAEAYPRLYVVRRPGEDGNAYGGPYIPASLGRRTASLVRKLFGIRTCKETLDGKRPRPCLQYQIKRCIAPCVAEICSPERYRRSCEDARLFLEGRTEEVTRRLREQMAAAAGAERYEEAASLRDQVQALVRLEAPQKITTTDIEERDLFAAHVEGERAAVQVFCVRDGKVVAREGFLLDRLTEPDAVLAETLQQFYASGRYVPREVVVPQEIPDRELLEAWLAARRGSGVRIHVPQRGEKLRLMELVARNARLAYDLEWKQARRQSQELLRALRDVVDLEVDPQRIECFDISNIQGADIVASMVVFENGLPKKADYRKFRDQERLGRARRLRLDARGGGTPLQAPARGGQGAARPDPDRRRQGPARGRGRGARGAGTRRAAGHLAREARGAGLRPRQGRADRAAAQLAGAAARPARARRGAPLRRRLPPPGALAPHDRVRARRDPRHRARQAAQAALGVRLAARRARRFAGRARGSRRTVDRSAPARPLRSLSFLALLVDRRS